MDFNDITNFYISVLMICSPFTAVPALLNMTQGHSLKEKKRVGLILAGVVALVLVASVWMGASFLQFFGIRVVAFEAAGGIIIFLLALSMLKGEVNPMKKTAETVDTPFSRDSIPIVPIAIPLMAGPGAISNVIVAADTFPGMVSRFYLTGCLFLVALTLGVLLYFASSLESRLGKTGMCIVNRLGGLILAAIAMEVLSRGLVGLFPGLIGAE